MDHYALRALLEWQVELGATEAIAEAPINRYEIADVKWHRKPSASRAADPAAIRELADTCDAVVIAIGD